MGRIGMLASGGDCQALNATMGSTTKSLYNLSDDVEIIGFKGRYKGLTYADYQIMKSLGSLGILTQGGVILGTSRQPFEQMRIPDENGLDRVESMKHTYRKLKLDCLMVLGGNGGQKTTNLLSQEGLNVVSPPKTIDNDLWGTGVAFGSRGAVDVATSAIDCIHTTAASHGRVFIVEVMGHKAGWLTLYAGLIGGADIILLSEVPRDTSTVRDALMKCSKAGKRFSVLVVAKGAISKKDSVIIREELEEKKKNGMVYPLAAYEIDARVQEITSSEVRVTVPGHMQRGGEPCSCDHVLATRLRVATARLIVDREYGYIVTVKNSGMTKVPLPEVAGKLKAVSPECSMIREARMVGISFGDE